MAFMSTNLSDISMSPEGAPKLLALLNTFLQTHSRLSALKTEFIIVQTGLYLSKVFESFVSDCLLSVIHPYLDSNQCGLKGSSIIHYPTHTS